MSRLAFDPYSPVCQRVIDGSLSAIAFWLAYQARFEGQVPPSSAIQVWGLLLAIPLGRIGVNHVMRSYRTIWRYVGLWDAIRLACSYVVFSLGLVISRYALPGSALRIPLGVILAELLLSFAGATAARVVRRILYERVVGGNIPRKKAVAVLLLGAGRSGVNGANQLRAAGNLQPVGFLDDDPKKIGLLVAGLKVLGPVSMLSSVIPRYAVQQVILCIPSPPREMLRRIWAVCELLGVNVKIVPTLEEMLGQKVSTPNFRNVEMNDLLGRKPLEQANSDPTVIAAYGGKRILITGAGGSIGSELALQLSKANPAALLLLDKDENGLNDTFSHLERDARARASAVIADLRFVERLRGLLQTFRPEVVFHAAAHKHVHLMEINPCEAITNNVTGTRNLIEQSLAFGVSRFVQISTDKAVNPTSVMGASKRVCEMMVEAQGRHAKTKTLFCCVRFGNVLGSRGSVIPIFQEQIERGGPITLTDREARRFLMTIPEAVCLLIQAGTLANNRDIFVLDMGSPVLIHKLAEDLIELCGLRPNRDIRIEITGLKQGEKLSEILRDNVSELRPTSLEKIKAISTGAFVFEAFAKRLRVLERCAWEGDTDEVYRHLSSLNIGYTSQIPQRRWPTSASRVAPLPTSAGTLAPELS